ncbi:MAG: hypothetical protein ABIP13_09540 [Tepidiformaceae bacterium]
MTRLELRNVPRELICGYLVDELGGAFQDDGSVSGEGWCVRFEDGDAVRFGPQTLVPVLFVEIDGSDAEQATTFVKRKAMRGGG